MEEGFRASGFNGAAVILDPRTGEVLSLVSLPAYDPNQFAAGIDRATWTSLNTDKLHPMQNRAIQGTYSPGSTFKIVVATAALEEGLVTPNFKVTCNGGANFYGRFFQCHKKEGHGTVDMRHALEQSCNVYFYTLGSLLKIDQIHKWATQLGLGVKSGIDLPNEQQGLVPSTEWKQRRFNEKWYPGETISVSIGQAQNSVTVDLARDDDGHRRQRRVAVHAEARQVDRRWLGVEADAAGGTEVAGPVPAGHPRGAARGPVARRQRRRAPAAAGASSGVTSPARRAPRR